MNTNNRNLTLLTDLYELTMMQGYFKSHSQKRVVFDVFYRQNPCGGAYAIACGLDQAIDYIKNLHFEPEDIDYLRCTGFFKEDFLDYLKDFHFTGDIYAIPEGTIIFPKEPLVKVVAPIMEAQLVETALLNIINHQSLIATKAARVVQEAGGGVMEFGLRRAQGPDAGIYGARAAVIAGCVGTSNVLAGQMFDIPVKGTHAHSWIMSFPSELEAFRTYAELFPDNCLLLVDTYDTLNSGVKHAIQVFKEMREKGIHSKLFGIRLDSGDLAYLTKKARIMLDEAGFPDAIISASSDLDEYLINSLMNQGAKITSWGVGTNLITSKDCPSFGGVYKLVAVKLPDGTYQPKMKCSDSASKAIIPGKKMPWRLYDENGQAQCDLIAMDGEVIEAGKPVKMVNLDPDAIERTITITPTKVKRLLVPHILNGELAIELPGIAEKKAYIAKQLTEETWETELRIEMPHKHYVNMTPAVAECRAKMYSELHGGKV